MHWLANLRLRMKLGLAFGVILALMLLISAISYGSLNRVSDRYDTAVYHMGEALFQSQVEIDHLDWGNELSNSFLLTRRFEGELDPTQCGFGQWYQAFEGSDAYRMASDEFRQTYHDLEAPHDRLHESAQRIVDANEAGDRARALEIYEEDTLTALSEVRSGLDRFTQILEQERETMIHQADRAAHQAQLAMGGGLGVAVLAALVMAGILVRYFAGSLELLRARTQDMANGRLGGDPLPVSGKDEIGEAMSGFNRMQQDMRKLVHEVMDSAREVASATDQLAAVAEQTQGGVRRQKQETDQVATAMNEMTATVAEVARNTQSAADAASSGDEAARDATDITHRAASAVDELASEIHSSADAVRDVARQSEEIGEVLTMIHGITEQTNMLALNAAIEAARAGDQGRGFAVVADEVRTLAGRTQESTVRIQEIIDGLQKGVSGAASAMEAGEQRASGVVDEVHTVSERLDQLASSITTIHEMTSQIASASEEQSQVSEEINRNLQSISTVADESSTASSQVAAASEQLSRLAAKLRDQVNRFTD